MANPNNFVAELSDQERIEAETRMKTVSPNDGKYYQKDLEDYITADAEWMACAKVQLELMRTRVEFGLADEDDLKIVEEAYRNINPLNISLIERRVTKHDQLAVLEEFKLRIEEMFEKKEQLDFFQEDREESAKDTAERIQALLHPGTTSYDILDTARSYLLKQVWENKLKWTVIDTIQWFIKLAEEHREEEVLQVGRTHLQHTAPVPFSQTFSNSAADLAERLLNCDLCFSKARWKVSGIVWTGASVAMIVSSDRGIEFEIEALKKLWLEPAYTATQVVPKEPLRDIWNSVLGVMSVIANFAGNMRKLYSSDIAEVTSLDSKKRLGWSSADASKNNPINYENIEWSLAVVESWMRILNELTQTDLQRDLRGSVQARYEPHGMISKTYESLKRTSRELKQLHVNRENVAKNLDNVRKKPTEPLVSILRWETWWTHSKYGVGHSFVKEIAKLSQTSGKQFMKVLFADSEFLELFETLPKDKQDIINGKLELYQWTSAQRTLLNLEKAEAAVIESLMT